MFSDIQNEQLRAPLAKSHVKSRKQGGASVSYIEGWHAIAEANRIFGFDGWSRENIEIKCVSESPREIGQNKTPGHSVTYIARVKVTVDGVTREGCGAGHGIDRDLGQAHESAIKEAETDAMKRALMTFGNPFGLALYDKAQANVADEPDGAALFVAECKQIIRDMPADRLGEWWNSDVQKQARRDFDLNQAAVDELKALVIAKINTLKTDKAA